MKRKGGSEPRLKYELFELFVDTFEYDGKLYDLVEANGYFVAGAVLIYDSLNFGLLARELVIRCFSQLDHFLVVVSFQKPSSSSSSSSYSSL